MNNQFDELTKSLAQSVTRRAALKKFGLGLAAAVAASLGIKVCRQRRRAETKGYCEISGFAHWRHTMDVLAIL